MNASPRSLRGLLALLSAAAVLGSVLAAAARQVPPRVNAAVVLGPPRLFPPDLLAAADEADRHLPPGAPLFYVTADADTWTCGLWQRALYPRGVFCLRTSNPRHAEIARELRARFGVRHAVGAAEPPAETPLKSRSPLTPEIWVGELAP